MLKFPWAVAAALMAPLAAFASSHREAPNITRMPSVDGTDFYMFNSYEPGRAGYVTLIANYQPFESPQGGPNYYTMDPKALYEIHIDNNGDGNEDLTFQFRFKTTDMGLAVMAVGRHVAAVAQRRATAVARRRATVAARRPVMAAARPLATAAATLLAIAAARRPVTTAAPLRAMVVARRLATAAAQRPVMVVERHLVMVAAQRRLTAVAQRRAMVAARPLVTAATRRPATAAARPGVRCSGHVA